MGSKRPLRVGYWWSSKKSLKFKDTEFADVCRRRGIDLAKLDLERPLEEQGPLDVVVHKLTNVLLEAEAGDPRARDMCKRFREYVSSRPDLVVVDPLDKVEVLLNRYNQYSAIQQNTTGLSGEEDVFVPSFVELHSRDVTENLSRIREAGIRFPIVCKPSIAHGTPQAHEMCLVFGEGGLGDLRPPCVVQEFVNHDAVLHKVFIIEDKYFVKQRPSLKNFYANDRETIFFNSHLVSKANSSSELTEPDECEEGGVRWPAVQEERLGRIAVSLGRRLGLALLGVDVIVDRSSGRHALIDINPFPGYDEVDAFFDLLLDVVERRCPPHHEAPQEDSGIETSDSCDERKAPPPPARATRRQHSKAA